MPIGFALKTLTLNYSRRDKILKFGSRYYPCITKIYICGKFIVIDQAIAIKLWSFQWYIRVDKYKASPSFDSLRFNKFLDVVRNAFNDTGFKFSNICKTSLKLSWLHKIFCVAFKGNDVYNLK